MRFLAALLLAFSIGSIADAQSQPLPDDRGQYSLIIVHEDQPSAATHRLLELFRSTGPLNDLAHNCATHRFTTSSPIYRERYAAALPPHELPTIALCRPDGGVIYKASGDSIPSTATALHANLTYFAGLERSLREGGGQPWDARMQCPDGNCPVDPSVPSRTPWLRPDGGLRPDGWIPDSIDLNPSVTVDVGEDLGLWILIGVLVLGAVCLVGFLLYLVTRD